MASPEVIAPDLAAHLVTYARPGDDGLVFTKRLCHSGNQLAADAGASLRELMDRMGHSTTRAAMVYLHGSDERQRVIADGLSKRAARELGRSKTRASATQRARRQGSAS